MPIPPDPERLRAAIAAVTADIDQAVGPGPDSPEVLYPLDLSRNDGLLLYELIEYVQRTELYRVIDSNDLSTLDWLKMEVYRAVHPPEGHVHALQARLNQAYALLGDVPPGPARDALAALLGQVVGLLRWRFAKPRQPRRLPPREQQPQPQRQRQAHQKALAA